MFNTTVYDTQFGCVVFEICMKPQALLFALAVTLVGCATTDVQEEKYRLKETTTLIPESIRVSPRGRNWEIEAYAQNEEFRFQLKVFATSCDDKSGSLWIESPNSALGSPVKALWGARNLSDRFFTAMCTVGIQMVDRAMAAEAGRPARPQMSSQERSILLQHLLNRTLPSVAPTVETRCEREQNSRAGAVVCVQK